MLPANARLARSFEDLPGEIRKSMTYRIISLRSHFRQPEIFLAEV
jgi:hypothetical protein